MGFSITFLSYVSTFVERSLDGTSRVCATPELDQAARCRGKYVSHQPFGVKPTGCCSSFSSQKNTRKGMALKTTLYYGQVGVQVKHDSRHKIRHKHEISGVLY